MLKYRMNPSVVIINGIFYMIAGINETESTTKYAERYIIENDKQEFLAPLISGAGVSTACPFEDKYIYMLANDLKKSGKTNCQRYTISMNKWELFKIN